MHHVATALAAATLLCTAISASAHDGLDAAEFSAGLAKLQSGLAAALGKGMQVNAETAFSQIKAQAGISGRKLGSPMGDAAAPHERADHSLKLFEQPMRFSRVSGLGTPAAPMVRSFEQASDLLLAKQPGTTLAAKSGWQHSPLTSQDELAANLTGMKALVAGKEVGHRSTTSPRLGLIGTDPGAMKLGFTAASPLVSDRLQLMQIRQSRTAQPQ